MKRTLKLVLKLLIVGAILGAIGRALSDKFTEGDDRADVFKLGVFFGGAERTTTAPALLNGEVAVCFGGVDLDLRQATLSSDGARIDLKVCMGGVQITVPDSWRVTVEEDIKAAGVDVNVTPPDELPEDAPRLEIAATARMGGVAVTTGN